MKLSSKMEESIINAKALLLQKEIPIQINLLAASLAKKNGTITVLDCGGRDDAIPEALI